MNNFSKFLYGGAMLLAFSACSSDDLAVTETATPIFEGDKAVMYVNIFSPENITRADGDIEGVDESANDENNQPNYATGEGNENKITSITFYFYNKLGSYATEYEAKNLNETGSGWSWDDTSDVLTEKVGTQKIVLTGLSGKEYPTYMIAVVNPPTALAAKITNKSLADASKILMETPTAVANSTTGFIMTSATYYTEDNEDGFYFASKLTEANFKQQTGDEKPGQNWEQPTFDEEGKPILDENENPVMEPIPDAVDIYVERLAAKVEVNFNEDKFAKVTDKKSILLDGKPVEREDFYETTLAGGLDIINIDENGNAVSKNMELKLLLYGCGLNGTAKKMNYFKKVNSGENAFNTTDEDITWNFGGTNRCYWEKSPLYDETGDKYPSSFGDVADNKKPETGKYGYYTENYYDVNHPILKYISWKDVDTYKFAYLKSYILPHTEKGVLLNLSNNTLLHSAVTEVLIAGQIVDKDYKPVTIYQLGETYYTQEGLMNVFLNAIKPNFWRKDGKDENNQDKVRTIAEGDVELTKGYDGTFIIKLSKAGKYIDPTLSGDALEADSNKITWYMDSSCTDSYASFDAVDEEILKYLPEKQTYCYKDGLMYYNVPIRHLRSMAKTDPIRTGHYGVVRNHWYKVTINSISNLGHSVYEPDEDIIPNSDDTQFMIGSQIRILSWRIVKQSADL